jgi:ankyrin repeat protein
VLIEFGADVNITGDLGNTPLHHAASRGNTEIASKLLRHGANPVLKNEFGQTPLDLSMLMKHPNVSAMLKKKVYKN